MRDTSISKVPHTPKLRIERYCELRCGIEIEIKNTKEVKGMGRFLKEIKPLAIVVLAAACINGLILLSVANHYGWTTW